MNWHHNPTEYDESPDTDDDRFLCACGHPQCWLLGNDVTNVRVGDRWFSADCAAICFFCGELDDMRNVQRISGSWLAHEGCLAQSPEVTDALEAQARADEARDAFEQRRR